MTRANGSLGFHMIEALVDLATDVQAFLRAASSNAPNSPADLRKPMKMHTADLADETSIDHLR